MITRHFSKIIFLVFALVFGHIVLQPGIAPGAEKSHKEQNSVVETTRIDNTVNNKLFEGYVNKLFYGKVYGSSNFGVSVLSQLN